ncbi:MAG: Gfo/Idh/MocA family oxidoreductase [Lachnospiraceae bacterium]|nr:Gfo/Idh/MocA family oxidoreductase [Lachnospiraceae bacterium]
MLRIGFADYYLDNWHANYYPGFLREAIAKYGYDAALVSAYALKDKEDGMTSGEWCKKNHVKLASSMEEMIDSVDAIMVIAADNSSWHEQVCQLPFASGKPVFVDKTFAQDVETGKHMFERAEKYKTPVMSTSAQRYCTSIMNYLERQKGTKTQFMSTVGPHDLSNYAVHQFEPIVTVMGTGVKRVKAFAVGEKVTQLILDYGEGRTASFTQSPNPFAEFNFCVSDGTNGERLDSSDYYVNAMKAILDFFESGVSPVAKEETLEVLKLIDAAKKARLCPDTWLDMQEV